MARPFLIERVLLFVFTFLVVVYIGVQLFNWRSDLFKYFLQAEKWPELVFLLAISFLITNVLARLLQWEYRIESGMNRPPKAQR
ncbi:MAG: hypothetical protein QXK06_05670 [Candidatus Diapherotrites archaeon]